MLRREFLLAGLSVTVCGGTFAKGAAPRSGEWSVRRMAAPGKGLAHPLKHVRCAINPENQRIYFCGGDFAGPVYMQSGRQEIYSYDLTQDDWRLEHPYCPAEGEIVPFHPDQVGWVWDSKRQVFWMLPGVQFGSSYGGPPCDGKRGVVTGFDPKTRRWTEPKQGPVFKHEYEPSKFAVYDAETDACIMLGSAESRHWSPETGNWDGQRFGGNRVLFGSYTAQVGRLIYAIDFRDRRIIRYDIDKRHVDDGPMLPFDPGANEMTNLVYARRHGKIFLARFAYGEYVEPSFWSFATESEKFEQLAVNIPGVPQPHCNTIVYHDGLDLMMLFGNLTMPADQRFYLYRP